MMQNTTTTSNEFNYVTTNRFYVEIESTISASFSECQGLGVTIKKEVQHEGGVNNQQRIFLGAAEFSDVTLKRGVTCDLIFWNWINLILSERTSGTAIAQHRRNVNILTFNQAGETMQCWTLIGAVPVSWRAPSLNADGSNVAVEELVLAFEGLNIVAKQGGGGATILDSRDDLGYFVSQ
jgi:phage tail-like protein